MIDLSKFKDETIAVLGLGKTGLPAARALKESGVPYYAWDDNENSVASAEAAGVTCTKLTEENLSHCSRLILSPGIPHTYPEPHPMVELARKAGVKIISDISLFLECYPENPVYAITGTNGKSTTTALLAHILEGSEDILMGGNIGKAVMDFKPPKNEKTAFVLELSSYQLELTPNLNPDVAVLLNVTIDHLDRHGGMDGYIAAKKMIFQPADGKKQCAILGVDDAPSFKIFKDLDESDWETVAVSTEGLIPNGLSVTGGNLVKTTEGEPEELVDFTQYKRLRGVHNGQNIACCYEAAHFIGLADEQIWSRVESFKGLPHRQYLARVINGISYVNDSKATNAEATSHALKAFNNIYWVVGGEEKEGGLNGLEPFMDHVRHAFVIGDAVENFSKWFDNYDVQYTVCHTIENAVSLAHIMAQKERGLPGGATAVMLSPACASWDQFKSFEHRGKVFEKLVEELDVGEDVA